jgi:cycloartenol synthase
MEVYTLVLSGMLVVLSALAWSRKPAPGYGSGANNNWSRRIRIDRPAHRRKHFQLADVWVYTGAGGSVDLDAVRDAPLGTVSAIDSATGGPLSGHLIGRQTWRPLPGASAAARAAQARLSFNPQANPNAGDKLFRAQMLAANGGRAGDAEDVAPRGAGAGGRVTAKEALSTGWAFFSKLQAEDGHWAGDYGGPLFLAPGLIIVSYVTGFDLGARKAALATYALNMQQEDGGWGLHLEGPSTVFSTTVNYCALRCLGLPSDHPSLVPARAFLHVHGGAVMNPHWGKFWMAVLGAFDWEGVNPIPPELWVLPAWMPFHPSKMWCHCRMPYLPMSYIYGTKRGLGHDHPLAAQLREELFPPSAPYSSIRNWNAVRNLVAPIDLYVPHTWLLDTAMAAFRAWETYAPRALFEPLRAAGLAFAAEYVSGEDLHTNYIDIGPVNKVANMLAVFYTKGRDSDEFARHTARLDDYLWVAEDGMKMQGYNGSQLWDTAFATQALAAAGPELIAAHGNTLARAAAYLDSAQAKEDVPHRARYFRTISKGGWPFSTADHGWPIADCTSEGLKATLAVQALASAGQLDLGRGMADGMGRLRGGVISPERLYDAVTVLLAFHNADGGWATYEEQRGGAWYEWLNPAEVWGDIMVDYTYTELTSASVQGLAAFAKAYPAHRPTEVGRALAAGTDYVRAQQREDGSWYGSWAVCFTYGCWFGVEALTAGGAPSGRDRAALDKCCAFLLSKQRTDGGWGESYLSCLLKVYMECESTAVNTAWALLALLHAGCKDAEAVERGVAFLIAHQAPSGDWGQEGCSGIFNRTCAITYTAYRNVFPLWALAAYTAAYPHAPLAGGRAPVASGAVSRKPARRAGSAGRATA